MAPGSQKTVLIVGGGFAGLSVAYALKSQYNCILLDPKRCGPLALWRPPAEEEEEEGDHLISMRKLCCAAVAFACTQPRTYL